MNRRVVDRIGADACFPYAYALGFFRCLARHQRLIQVITYSDLNWGADEDFQSYYPQEHQLWQQSFADGLRSRQKIYLSIQHDVDQVPQRTHTMLRDEEHNGLRSNVMLFHEQHNRQILEEQHRIVPGDYSLDWDECRRLQDQKGMTFGYHANAFERSLFDPSRAVDLFLDDVQQLRTRLDIRYFSPHGGVRSPRGQTNADWIPPAFCLENLRWVHNRFGCRFDGNWSDGGPNGGRDPRERDLRDFVKTWTPGKRYRVLLHPQYYDFDFMLSRRLLDAEWYRELTERCDADHAFDPWAGVQLGRAA